MPSFAEIRAAVLEPSALTVWWGECAHILGLLWLTLALTAASDSALVALAGFVAYTLLVTVPFAVARRRRWGRGDVDPWLPWSAIAAFVVAGGLTIFAAVRLELSVWELGLALTVLEVLLFALSRRLVERDVTGRFA
jgi:hypothetical protein